LACIALVSVVGVRSLERHTQSHAGGETGSHHFGNIAEISKNLFPGVFRATETMSNSQRLPLNPTALALADAARALSQVSGHTITEEMLRADVEAGAPTNPDGTLNLVHYGAWLAKEMGRGD
jgi:hypothetical protein